MKLKPAHLFYLLAILALLLIPLTINEGISVANHDTYFEVSYLVYHFLIFLLALLTGIAYSILQKLKRPIPLKTAIIHFSFMVIGLLFSLKFYAFVVVANLSDNIPNPIDFIFNKSAFLEFLLGPSLLLMGFLVFLYGLVKVIWKGKVVG